MRILAAAVVALSLGAPLAGQSTGVVHGVVTDTAGRPIANVRVEAPGAGLAAVTDSSGRYMLAGIGAGSITLRAMMIGFYPAQSRIQLAAADSVIADFRLRANPLTVSPVVVTAAKRSQILDQAVTSVSLVSERQIAHRVVNTIDEAVDKTPGVQLLNGQINIRGSSGFAEGLGSRVLLLVDGVPANQGDRGGINWDLVPADRVERVEVVKGAGSALYGSSAFGGVVNLITREVPEGWHARVRATAGVFADPPHDVWRFRGYTGVQHGLDIAGSYGRATLRGGLSAGARHSDGYQEQDRADHWQATGQGEWRPGPATIVRFSGAWASDQYQVPEPWCSGSGECDDRGQAYQPFLVDTDNRGNRTRSDKRYLTALLTRTPSERITWLARASWLRTQFTNAFPQQQPPSSIDFSIANRFGGEVRLVNRSDTRRVVTVGAEAARSDVLSDVFSGDSSAFSGDTVNRVGTHTQDELAAYAEAEQVAGPVRFTVGARSDFQVVDGDGLTAFVSPRAGVVWPTRTGSWRASAGRAFRGASLAERFVTTFALGFRVIPNRALRSEDGWSAEVGRTWTPRSWVRSDAALFYTQARRLIEPVFDDSALVIQFQNVQRAVLMGLDLSVTATPVPPHVTTSLAYQYLYARELATDTSPQRPLLFRPRHLLTLSADGAWRAFGVGADFRYSSRYERADPLYGDPRLAVKVLDLRAGWTQGSLAVRLKVANALNYIYNLAPRVLESVRTATLILTFTH